MNHKHECTDGETIFNMEWARKEKHLGCETCLDRLHNYTQFALARAAALNMEDFIYRIEQEKVWDWNNNPPAAHALSRSIYYTLRVLSNRDGCYYQNLEQFFNGTPVA